MKILVFLSIVVYASLPLVLLHPHQMQSKFITEKSENLNKVKRIHTFTHTHRKHTHKKTGNVHVHTYTLAIQMQRQRLTLAV